MNTEPISISEMELKDGNLIHKNVVDRIYSNLGSEYNAFLILIKTEEGKKYGLFVHKNLVKDLDNENTGDDNVRFTKSPLIGFYIINEKELVTLYGNDIAPFISNDEILISTNGVKI